MCAVQARHTLDIAQSLSMQPKSFHQKTCLASQVGCKIEILLSSRRPRLLTRSVSLPAMSPGNQSPLLPGAGIFIDLLGKSALLYYYGQEEFVEAEAEAEAEERASEEWSVSSPPTAFTAAISFVSRFCSVATMLKTLR